jgi:hypothetical protein
MKRLKVRRACLIVLLVALCIVDQSLAQTTRKIPLRLPLTSGTVQDNTYKNESLGLQFTPPPGLKFTAPELKGNPGSVPLLVTITAWSEVNGGAVFYADDMGYYPENRRSTKAYVERVVQTHKNEGLELVEGTAEGQLGGATFARADFRKPSRAGYEIVFVKACDEYAFIFIFAGPDQEAASRLMAQSTVKLDMKKSGCGGNTVSIPQHK